MDAFDILERMATRMDRLDDMVIKDAEGNEEFRIPAERLNTVIRHMLGSVRRFYENDDSDGWLNDAAKTFDELNEDGEPSILILAVASSITDMILLIKASRALL